MTNAITFEPFPANKLFKDMTGRRFGRLVIIGFAGGCTDRFRWYCQCDCGNVSVVTKSNLVSGHTTSCGCYHKERKLAASTRHGKSHTKVHNAWNAMLDRCTNANYEGYPLYGGRGIAVCERWRVFENFFADMGEPPSPQHSLDRIDVNGNYEPSNCRWATAKEQSRNRRSNVIVTYQGVTSCLLEHCERLALNYHVVSRCLRKGWPLDLAITAPLGMRHVI